MPKSKQRKKKVNRTDYGANKGQNASSGGIESTILDQEIDIRELQGRSERFINDNKRLVMIVAGLIFLIAGLYFFFTRVYIPGQEAKAQNDIFQAQTYFEQDSFRLALNGDGNYSGFLDVIDDYSGMTKTTNLAKYYAGISFLNIGEYQSAIDYLGKFKGKDKLVSAMALGAMGDAYMELGDDSNGISYYQKAATRNANELTSPLFLLKAGMALERSGDLSGAKTMYERLKDYPTSAQGREATKYLQRIEAKM